MTNRFSAILSVVFITLLYVTCNNSTSNNKTTNTKAMEFIDNLMKKMTLEEKIGQLNQLTSRWEMTGPASADADDQKQLEMLKNGQVGSMLNVCGVAETTEAQKLVMENTRLKIPMLFAYDVIHGYKTMFPVPLAESCAWDAEISETAARIAAEEAAASGLHWTFGPMMDLSRDARWGRVMESCGEDPYLASILSVAKTKGFQANDLNAVNTIAACAKHYAAYGFVESGRDYNTVDIGTYTLHNVVLPPFKASAKAGIASFMNSFNIIDGTPSTASTFLQRDLLKGKWAFEGLVISDWGSILEIVSHGAAKDLKEASKKAITAGSDIDMESFAYVEHLKNLVEEGEIDIKLIDDAVRRVLTLKYKLGLFDNPYKYSDIQREKEIVYSTANQEAARMVACNSMVLLKNKDEVLPISKKIKSIAVIGPLADDKDAPLGSWRAKAVEGSAVSLLEGLKNALPNTIINYAKGCDLAIGERGFVKETFINESDISGFKDAVDAAKKSDIIVLALGEDCWQTGEGRSQANIELRGVQMQLFNELRKLDKKVVVVLMNGRPLAIPKIAEQADAILESWFGGSQAGNAIADILLGDFNPSGKLSMSFPYEVGQCPVYYNHMSTGRGNKPDNNNVFWSQYIDAPHIALYPFGYGLSYTKFEYGKAHINNTVFSENEEIKLSVNIKNTGKYEGKEIVQLYIHDLHSEYTRPVKELKAFKKISLKPDENKTVEFTLTSSDLAYYYPSGEYVVEPGMFEVLIGSSSVDLQILPFELKMGSVLTLD